MATLILNLQDDKQPEYLRMALEEVARQIGEGVIAGRVHGEKWLLHDGTELISMSRGLWQGPLVRMEETAASGYTKHCRACGMLLQTYCPPPA